METQERRQEKTGFPLFSTLLGASVGALVGVIVGVLIAPKSGSETREQIGDWVRDKRDAGAEMLAGIKDQALRKKEQVASAFKSIVGHPESKT
ncbi:MAG: YtxH domain-containing protein [Elusimicrobia bacterium]|nr:YtxH domain-containing protein [Elusimicrobiota bacterium]